MIIDQNRFLVRTVKPSAMPVTLQQVYRTLDLGDDCDPDVKAELTDMISEATDIVERDSRRSLMPQQWRLNLDYFPLSEIELDKPPIRSVDEGDSVTIQYVKDGVTVTMDSDLYQVDSDTEPARIYPANCKPCTVTGLFFKTLSACWPVADCIPNAVTITFATGWQSREALPPVARRAVLLAVKSLYHGCEMSEAYWGTIDRLKWEIRT